MGEVKRNCWTCGWDRPVPSGRSCVPSANVASDWIDGVELADDMPSPDADGCPGWKPKPGAENTDRAQLAALGDSDTATVKESLTVRPGWRGNLPICRGPGGIQARRLRAMVRRGR